MHQKKSKKIVIYFFLLILLSSINNLQLNNEKFGAIKKINITGLEKKDNQILLNKLKKINLENIFFINHIKLTEVLEKNSLVHNFNVKKKYPSSLDIEIKKTDFVATSIPGV